MNKTYTNKIFANIDADSIRRDFIVCQYTTSEKYIKGGAMILDRISDKLNAKSIVFESGKKFFALFDRASAIRPNAFVDETEFDSISVQEVHIRDIEQYIAVRLFLNALNNFETESMKFNNLTGKLYCTNSNWYVRTTKGAIRQFKSVEVAVSRDMNIKLKVVTFTSLNELKWLNINKNRLHEYPVYDFVGLNMLRRVNSNAKQGYIKKQYENKKSRIPFIDFSCWENYCHSKCGVLYFVLAKLNEKFGDYIKIGLNEVEITQMSEFKESFEYAQKIDHNKKIAIIDRLHEADESFSSSIYTRLLEYGFSNVEFSSELVNDSYNIVLINNKEFYENNKDLHDPHFASNSHIIQHLTYEDFADSEMVLDCIVKEMRIKQDVVDCNVTYANWGKFEFNEEISFCIRHTENKYAFLKIAKDGLMQFKTVESDIFENSLTQKIINDYCLLESEYRSKVECVIFSKHSSCAILQTEEYTLPQIQEVGSLLKAEVAPFLLSKQQILKVIDSIMFSSKNKQTELGRIRERLISSSLTNYDRDSILALTSNRVAKKDMALAIGETYGVVVKTYLRGANIRDKLFASNLNINYINSSHGQLKYFVGEKNRAINTVLQTASLIRRVIPLNGEIDMRIFQLLAVDFVRKEQFTVLPFPVKYLREYCCGVQ